MKIYINISLRAKYIVLLFIFHVFLYEIASQKFLIERYLLYIIFTFTRIEIFIRDSSFFRIK